MSYKKEFYYLQKKAMETLKTRYDNTHGCNYQVIDPDYTRAVECYTVSDSENSYQVILSYNCVRRHVEEFVHKQTYYIA